MMMPGVYQLLDVLLFFAIPHRASILQHGGSAPGAQPVEEDSISMPAVIRSGVNGRCLFTFEELVLGFVELFQHFKFCLYCFLLGKKADNYTIYCVLVSLFILKILQYSLCISKDREFYL